MDVLPALVPPLPRAVEFRRGIAQKAAFEWLRAGWSDFKVSPGLSLAYGFAVLAASLAVVGGLFWLGWGAVLFPALSAFLVVGPILAVGLYEKSRLIAAREPLSLTRMVFVKAASGRQILMVGVVLCLLMALWMRAAVIIYALFFGMRPFSGFDQIARDLFTTPTGLSMLAVGGVVGGLFAALSFAISVLSIPVLLTERIDAFTAMGTSMALVWNNMPVMIAWGAIVAVVFALCLVTGLLGLVVLFPLLGHATWHACQAMRVSQALRDEAAA